MTTVAILITLITATSGPATARSSDSVHQVKTESSVNNWRAKNDKVALRHSACLDKYADSWARYLARRGTLVHRPTHSLRAILRACGMRSIGENLARGGDSSMGTGNRVTYRWMLSPGHKRNMLTTSFRYQAVGSYYANGQWWVASLLARR